MSTTPITTHENTAGHEALAEASRAAGVRARIDRFFFLRHGRTAGNIGRVYQHPDIPLATEGFADADAAASVLKDHDFEVIYASDMARAWLTAGRVAFAANRPVHPRFALRERYFGDFIGTSSEGLDWRRDVPNGESMQGFIDRVVQGADEMLSGGPLPLLVSHGGVLRVLGAALDIEVTPALAVNALPLEFTRVGGVWNARPLADPPAGEMFRLGAA